VFEKKMEFHYWGFLFFFHWKIDTKSVQ
jgi:hypothetical protein